MPSACLSLSRSMADVSAQRNRRISGGLLQRHDFAGAVARFWQVYTRAILFSLFELKIVTDLKIELLCTRLRGHVDPPYHVHSCMIPGAELAKPSIKSIPSCQVPRPNTSHGRRCNCSWYHSTECSPSMISRSNSPTRIPNGSHLVRERDLATSP